MCTLIADLHAVHIMTNSNSTLSVLTAQFRRTQKPLLYIGFLNDHVGEAFQGACKSPYTQVRQHD